MQQEVGAPFFGEGTKNEGQTVGKRAGLGAQHPAPKCSWQVLPNTMPARPHGEQVHRATADVLAWAGGNLRS